MSGKVLPLPVAQSERERLRARGLRVVLTNGHFDLLHVGHVRYLQAARSLGDRLIVGLNGDDTTRRLKGEGRPYVGEAERAELLAALAWVDYVVIFHEVTAESLVDSLRPDIYVKGGDYGTGKPLPEGKIVAAYGGVTQILPFHEGHSTTALIQRIRGSPVA